MELSDLNRLHEADQHARGFIEIARTKALGGSQEDQILRLEMRLGARSSVVEHYKAAVTEHTTANTPNLALARESAAFLSLMAKRTVLGQLPGVVPMPPNLQAPIAPSGAVADFVAESSSTPVLRLDVGLVSSTLEKLALIVVISKDLLVSAHSSAMRLFESHLLRAVRLGEDRALLSSAAAVAGERPAGLLNGLAPVGGGTSLAEDLDDLWAAVRDGDPERPAYVLSARAAAYLAALTLSDGTAMFPSVSPVTGGTIAGVPVIISRAAGGKIILVDAAVVGVADGGARLDEAHHTTVEMDDAPSGIGTLVSLFQKNLVGVRIARFISWKLGAADGVAYLELPINGSPA